jgi:hypothetical protein
MGCLAAGLLLLPGAMTALVWTDLNLVLAAAAVLIVVVVRRRPKLCWLATLSSALIIAVPPYPYWVFWSEREGWHLHFFSGFTWQAAPVGTFAVVFLVAVALLRVLLWAFRSSTLLPNSSSKPTPLRGAA